MDCLPSIVPIRLPPSYKLNENFLDKNMLLNMKKNFLIKKINLK